MSTRFFPREAQAPPIGIPLNCLPFTPEAIVQTAERKLHSWRIQPNWSRADWFEEMHQIALTAAWLASISAAIQAVEASSIVIMRRVIAAVLTAYRHEWAYGTRNVPFIQRPEDDDACHRPSQWHQRDCQPQNDEVTAGDLSTINYSDGVTPTINYGYDRRGRQIAITNGSTVCSLSLDDVGDLLSESYTGGPLDGLTVTNKLDQFLRRTNLALLNSQPSTLTSINYSWDAASRLLSVSSGTNSATYTYIANSPLVSQIAFTNGNAQRMVTTKSYDYLNRLTSISSVPSASSAVNFSYSYNSANQRTSATNAENARWVYTYDSLGQVISGKKYWSDGSPVAGQQFEYSFDDIGNRKSTAAGGNNSGTGLRSANYSANNLNQYTSRDVPGYENVLGAANSNATVLVWAATSSYGVAQRKGDYFRSELPVNNSTSALWLTITNFAALNNGTNADILTNVPGNVFIPKTAEVFGYDLDGNTTNDGRWALTWDGENRLLSMESHADANLNSKLRLDFAYDYFGRRTQKIVSTNNGSGYVPEYTNRFADDGWNLIGTLNGTNGLSLAFAWGLDVSGSEQDAGGVGGLLFVSEISDSQISNSHLPCFDGNGNLMALVNAISGAASAQYDYGPFGEPLRSTGPMAKANALAFSTRFYDIESGALYYGSRYFKADSGRWLSRDPLAEAGGANIHAFSDNDPVNNVDPIGENANPAFVIDAIKHGSRTATHHLRIYLVLEAAAYGTALKGRPMTSQFLFHYLDASGTALTLTSDQVNQIRQEPGFAKDEELNINKILKSLTDGSVDYKGTIQHHTFDQDVSPVDLFSAFHEIDFKSSLKGCVTKSSTVNTFDGTLTTELHDNWNFSNPDPRYSQRRPFNTIPSLPSSIRSITEEEFRQLELNGYVKAFDVDGKKVESVSIKAYGSTSVVSVKPSSTY